MPGSCKKKKKKTTIYILFQYQHCFLPYSRTLHLHTCLLGSRSMYSITMYLTGTKLVCSELGSKVYIYVQLPHTDLSASQCRLSLSLCSAQPSRTGVFLSALSFCPAWLSHLSQGPTPAQQVNQCHPMPTVRQRGKYNADFGALELI